MRHNTSPPKLIKEALRPFTDLIEPNEWLNFEEMSQRIRISESLSNSFARTAIMTLYGNDGIVRECGGEIQIQIIHGGYVLGMAS